MRKRKEDSTDFDYQGLILLGASGNVGTRLIEKVTEEDYPQGKHWENEKLERNPVNHQHPSLITAIADRGKFYVDINGIPASLLRASEDTRGEVKDLLNKKGREYNDSKEIVAEVQKQIRAITGKKGAPNITDEHMVYVDMTDGQTMEPLYDEVIQETQSGIVAVNKGVLANVTPEKFRNYNKRGRLEFKSTVGAGADAVDNCLHAAESAHPIKEIIATLSGTCGLYTQMLDSAEYKAGKIQASDIVRMLEEEGHTEPHPHTDLSGEDVKKKIVILARASGYDVSMADIIVDDPIVPDEYFREAAEDGNLDAYYAAIKGHDEAIREKVEHLGKKEKLAYVARMTVNPEGKAEVRVGLEVVRPKITKEENRTLEGRELQKRKDEQAIARAEHNFILLRDDIQTRKTEKPGSGRDVTAAAIQDGIKKFVPIGQTRFIDEKTD